MELGVRTGKHALECVQRSVQAGVDELRPSLTHSPGPEPCAATVAIAWQGR